MAEIVRACEISKRYRIGGRENTILDRVSLTVNEGEFVAIAGASGSGKTTLLGVLSGLDSPSAGQVVVAGQDITRMSEDRLAPLRNQLIGYVFQSFYLVPSLNALENVAFPAELRGDPHARSKAAELLAQVGLAGRAENFPSQLSGGEQQRVAICRAMVNQPRLLFADEPTGNLDSGNGAVVIDLLQEINRQGTTLILATHSPALTARAGRILQLADGRLQHTGDSQ